MRIDQTSMPCTLTGSVESILERAYLLDRRRCFARWPAEQRVPHWFAPQLCKENGETRSGHAKGNYCRGTCHEELATGF